jgi:hypothetical protein
MGAKQKFTTPQLVEYGQLSEIVHGLGGWPDPTPSVNNPDPPPNGAS